jgi:RNase P subunit RPR2
MGAAAAFELRPLVNFGGYMPWDRATKRTKCTECEEPIHLGARIMRAISKTASMYRVIDSRVTYCENCGKLYEESQEIGEP